ncbi:acyltransferase family protein [Pseudomonas sp. R3-52-08]|uniref:acyltransferase family protein n=1 Tax=Pseudomonas sp. R3-52-08 TaxID=1173284 RepID=UPI000F6C7BE1|nr:acyltransferase family protein [Pseudomonas sp. R3-52-08]AZF22147.1 O-antigen acetylase [Pseudomonas sp. R3-52-08]
MNLSKYVAGIDGLRAIAVMTVLLFHTGLSTFGGGYVGVDVFFVISGYLITNLITDEVKQTGMFSFKTFYTRRIRRLFPALFATILLTFVFAILMFTPQHFQRFGREVISSILSVSNFVFWSESGYFNTASEFKPLLHTWSLSVEEQFYLLWPAALVFLLTRKSRSAPIIAIVVSGITSLILNIVVTDGGIASAGWWQNLMGEKASDTVSLIYFFTPFRVFEFAIGAALVWIPKAKEQTLKLDLLMVIGLSLIFFAVFSYTEKTLFPSYNALAPCIGAALVIYSVNAKYAGWVVRNRIMVKIGLISYSVYLVHWPIIVFYKYYTKINLDLIEQLVIVTASLALGFIFQRYIETPFRKSANAKSIAPKLGFIPACGGLAAFISITAVTVLTGHGWQWRLSPLPAGVAEQLANSKQFHMDQYGGADYPWKGWISGGQNGMADMVVIGDSHARHYATGLDLEIAKPLNKSIYISVYGCMMLPGMTKIVPGEDHDKGCQSALDNALDVIDKSPNTIVVISQFWMEQLVSAAPINTKKKILNGTEDDGYRFVTEKLAELKTRIGNRQLVIVGNVPGAGKSDVIGCFSRPRFFSSDCEQHLGVKEDGIPTISGNSALERFAASTPSVTFLNPFSVFCENRFCKVYGDEKVYYSDSFHLSKAGSVVAIHAFKDKLVSALNHSDSLRGNN